MLKPNVLIDATATRDVTAWQQLAWPRHARAAELDQRLLPTAAGARQRITVRWTPRSWRRAFWAASTGSRRELETLRRRALDDGMPSLSWDERQTLRIGVILGRNKVTHIYELVKAFGSTRQVEYDRKVREWRRREAIERKHAYEHAVDIRSGEVVRGVAHAPLVYQSDPRTDLPEGLGATVTETIRDRDVAIVNGWLEASAAV